jgi:hypothetical protein
MKAGVSIMAKEKRKQLALGGGCRNAWRNLAGVSRNHQKMQWQSRNNGVCQPGSVLAENNGVIINIISVMA